MDDLLTLQQHVGEKSAQHTAAADAFYQCLQEWSLAEDDIRRREAREGRRLPATDELVKKHQALRAQAEALQQQQRDAQTALEAARTQVAQIDTPQKLLEQIPADIPFLLLPLRLEARYITFQHVVRHLPLADVVDISTHPAGAGLANNGFVPGEYGGMTYQVPALQRLHTNHELTKEVKDGT